MKKTLLIFALAFLLLPLYASAQIITGTLTDENKQPIPYASVIIGPTYGVVTNTEGVFVVDITGKTDIDKVIFSCLGYENLTVPFANFKAGTYMLKEQANVLDEVFITNKKYTPTELLTKVMENASKNYAQETVKQNYFLRATNEKTMIDSDFKLVKASLDKKASLKEINKDIEESIKKGRNRNSQDFVESYGSLYEQNGKAKLYVQKAIELKNRDKDVSGDQVNNKLLAVLNKYLDPNATYKVRSGIIPIQDSMKVGTTKKEVNDVKTAGERSTITSLSSALNKFYTDEELDFLTEFKRYEYTLEGYATYNDETIYIIDFKPARGSAHYYGKIYVNAFDFAVVKLDYNLADGENIHKVNLKLVLGVKYIEDRTKVSATFIKNEAGHYAVNFVKKQIGTYTYMDRSLKLTKNKVDKDEEEKMLKIDLMMEMDCITTYELSIMDRAAITADEFNAFTEKEKYNVNYISKYDASVWKDYNVLAPVDAIKKYN